jgi:orotidine-5'-phosphate decarboxylase
VAGAGALPSRSGTAGLTPAPGFGDALADRVATRQSQVVLGLDPDPGSLWPGPSSEAIGATPSERAAAGVRAHCIALIDAGGPACVAVKLQLACFERLGPAGWQACFDVAEHARGAGLLVIADGKRGDVSVTSAAYGQALFGGTPTPFGRVAGLGADVATVNPLMGADSLAPLVSAARAQGAAVLALVRTSNAGASDVQELELAAGGTVSERLARLVEELGAPGVGALGLSDVGAVVGATAPERLERLRELMPHAVWLLPGVGAQGGRVEDLAAAFAPGRAAGLVSASRSIVGAYLASGGDPAHAARTEAERLRAVAWSLS